MTTDHSHQVAGFLFTDPRVSHIQMIPELALVFAEKLDEYKNAIEWMSGSPSFAPDEEAHDGWVKIRDSLLRWPDANAASPQAQAGQEGG